MKGSSKENEAKKINGDNLTRNNREILEKRVIK